MLSTLMGAGVPYFLRSRLAQRWAPVLETTEENAQDKRGGNEVKTGLVAPVSRGILLSGKTSSNGLSGGEGGIGETPNSCCLSRQLTALPVSKET